MNAQPIVIRVALVNRILIYWIPMILLYFSANHLAWNTHDFNLGQGILFLVTAAIFIAYCEAFLFGFRVELTPNDLVYYDRGAPIKRATRLLRSEICNAKYQAAIRTDGKPWKFVEVISECCGSRNSTLINVTAFSARDVKTILEWMPNLNRD